MTVITFKPESTFRTEDHKANLMNSAKIQASLKEEDYPERDKLKAAIDRNENSDVAPELRIKALAEGRSVPVPATLEAQLHEVQVRIRDKNDALDFLAVKRRIFETEAGKKMVEDARPQIVAAEKNLFEVYQELYEKFLPLWLAKRSLLNESIGTYGLFANSFDEFFGIPVDLNSAWCELFREGIAAGHIKKMPQALLPKR